MKTLRMTAVAVLLGTVALTASGCSWAQKGAAGGGVVGAAAGAAIGNATTAAPATGFVVGGTSGALVGGAAGDVYEQVTAADTERELENLRAEVLNKESEIAALRASGLSPEKEAELAAAQARLSELEQQLADARSAVDTARAELAATAMTRSALEGEVSSKGGEISALQTRLSEAESRAQLADQEAARLAEETARLASEADTLRAAVTAKELQLKDLNGKVEVLQTSLQGKQQQLKELEGELNDLNVKLEETSRGLTLTIAESLLYQPGKAELTKDGQELLGQVAKILQSRFPTNDLIVEGHTDNQPIKHSGWRSNWELGAARSLTMVHELVDNHGIAPGRISASTYGEFDPATGNDTADGRRLNRRAVIVIVPEKLPLQRQSLALAD